MSCERFRDAITDHACGAAIDAEPAAHVAACAACRRAYDAHRRVLADVDEVLGQALAVPVSADFFSRVQAQVHVRSPHTWMAPRNWALGLAAAAAGVSIAVFVAWQPTDPQPSVSVSSSAASEFSPVASVPSPVASVPSPVASGFSRKDVAVAESPTSAARILPPNRLRQGFGESAVASAKAEGGSHKGARDKAGSHAEPDVIVPPDQLRAIVRLRQLIKGGVLDETKLPPQKAEADALAELTVAPLTVPDIDIPDIETAPRTVVGGERERRQ